MAKARAIVKRRKTVRNVRKITRTMQLIATARFQAAMNRAVASKPYTRKLAELVAALSRTMADIPHPLMQTHQGLRRSVLVAITSNRGLCGGYNANVLRAAVHYLKSREDHDAEVDVHMIGKKGIAYFRFLRRPMVEQMTDLGDAPRFEQIEPIANALMDRFAKGEIESAHVAYMKFLSAGQQRPTVLQLLPLTADAADGDEPAASEQAVDFEFSPPQRNFSMNCCRRRFGSGSSSVSPTPWCRSTSHGWWL